MLGMGIFMSKLYYMPTKVIMGNGCIAANSGLLADMGKKALIVTGRHSAKANGSLVDVIAVLNANKQEYVIFDSVMANPTIECAYAGAAFARENSADFVIAIGGGSPMDAAKAMALLARQDIREEDLFSGVYSGDVLPMAFVPTTAGTGSEVTQYSILTNHKAETKTSIASPVIFPKLAFLDARYMEGLSYTTTINTAIDALSHSVEGMLSNRASTISDSLAMESIRLIASCFESLKNRSLTREQRESLLYASTLAGMVIANTGTTAVHAMGYSLTYYKDIDHGRANGLLLAAFLGFVEKSLPDRVRTILSGMKLSAVKEFSSVLEDLLGEKESISMDEINNYCQKAIKTKNITNSMVVPGQEDLLETFTASFQGKIK
jgi:alcohol dehydrogenase class IV